MVKVTSFRVCSERLHKLTHVFGVFWRHADPAEYCRYFAHGIGRKPVEETTGHSKYSLC